MAIPWPDAVAVARTAGPPMPAVGVMLRAALNRTLSAPVTALTDLPGFATSAMDGWAVAGPGPWRLTGEILAGARPGSALAPGEAVGIATGAAVPQGADAVVRRENGRLEQGIVRAEQVSAGADIRPRGEECRAGEELALAGTVVGPGLIGLLAAAGHDRVQVAAVPGGELLLLGDELLDAGVPGVGVVRDSLGPQLPGWLDRLGARVAHVARVPDTVVALTTALEGALSRGADVIVTTGGTAAGPVDCLHTALHRMDAELLVDSVAVRPGHPMVLARIGAVPVLGLPGNPQSAVVALMSLGAPLLRGMLRRPEPVLSTVQLTTGLSAPAAEHRLVLGTVRDAVFRPVTHLGSAMLRGLAVAQGFAVLPPGGAAAGSEADWLPLP
jgi:molybdopterin molybdotransferase